MISLKIGAAAAVISLEGGVGGIGTGDSAKGLIDNRAVGGLTKTELVNKTPAVVCYNKSGQVQYCDSADGKHRLDSNVQSCLK